MPPELGVQGNGFGALQFSINRGAYVEQRQKR